MTAGEPHGHDSASARSMSLLRPHFDETTLFLLAVSFILTCTIPSGPAGYLWWALGWQEQGADVVLPLVAAAAGGLLLSLYHAVATREKLPIEKALMGGFAILVNAAAGISVAIPMLQSREFGLSAIFPAANIVGAILLLYSFGDHETVADENASPVDLLVGTSALIVVFVTCVLLAKTSWAFTFSACVAYSTLAHRIFAGVPVLFEALRRGGPA